MCVTSELYSFAIRKLDFGQEVSGREEVASRDVVSFQRPELVRTTGEFFRRFINLDTICYCDRGVPRERYIPVGRGDIGDTHDDVN